MFSAYFTIIWALSSMCACYTYMYILQHTPLFCSLACCILSYHTCNVTVAISIHALENSIRQHVYMHILTLCDVILIHSLNMTSDLHPPTFTIQPFWESTNANPANISSPVVLCWLCTALELLHASTVQCVTYVHQDGKMLLRIATFFAIACFCPGWPAL